MRPTSLLSHLLLSAMLPALLAAAPLAPVAPPAGTDVRVVVLNDFNGPYGSLTYPAELTRALRDVQARWKPALLLAPGDLIAGQRASLADARVQAMWAAFEADVRAPLQAAGIPLSPAMGNHDASVSVPRDRREAARYWAAHPLPAPLRGVDLSDYPFRYSYTLSAADGRSLFVAVIDASGPTVDAGQRRWLAQQLAGAPARAAGVRLVAGHLPLAGISREKNRPGEVIADPDGLRAVMQAGGVLAYVSGHHAAYFPGRLGGLNVLACGGIGGRDYVGYPGTARSTYTVLDLNLAAGRAALTTLDAASGEAIDPRRLPARIDGLQGPVTRVDDLRP